MPFLGPAKPAKLSVKHELEKPDSFLLMLESISIFYHEHKKNMLTALGGIVFLLMLYYGYSYFVGMRNVNASFAEYEAGKIFREDVGSGAAAAKPKYANVEDRYKAALAAYQHVVDEYEKTPSGRRAALGVANCYFRLGKYADAIKIYKNFTSMFPDSDFVYLAMRNIALCYEAEGKTEEALSALQTSLQSGFVGKMSYWDIGRIYEKKNELKKALDAYKSFQAFAKDPQFADNSVLGDDADKKIASIELKINAGVSKKS